MPSGVINRQGTLALVANRAEGTVSVFTIQGKTVAPAGVVRIADDKSGPSHVVFHQPEEASMTRRRAALLLVRTSLLLLLLAGLALPPGVEAQLAVSSNDNKVMLEAGGLMNRAPLRMARTILRGAARRYRVVGGAPSPMTRPTWGGRGSRSCERWIRARRSRISGAIGAPRRVSWLTCRDISSLVAAR